MSLRKLFLCALLPLLAAAAFQASAQYIDGDRPAAKMDSTVYLTLDDALRIALSENVSVKVADKEIERTKYAQKGTYASLFPQVNLQGMFSYAIQKQKVYFGSDAEDDSGSSSGGGMASMMSGLMDPIMYYIQNLYVATGTPFIPYVAPEDPDTGSDTGSDAVEMGRRNQVQAALSASMPIVNFQLWESLRLSGDQVELAVEQARESRLGMVSSVKQAYFAVLMAREAYNVYQSVYENAIENYRLTEMKYNAQKASELDLTRAKANIAAAIPNVYNAENSIGLALWQLKAVMGVSLDEDIDVAGSLDDYAEQMFREYTEAGEGTLEGNSQLKQLATQAEMLARQIRMQQYAYLPTLSMSFSYNYYTQSDVFNLSQWKWLPSSSIALSLSIPIFSGGQRLNTIRQTRVQADELELQRVNAERQLKIGIRQSLSTMETAMRSYQAAKDALDSAEKAYDIASKSYQVGRSTLTDLSNTELVLTQTRLQASQAVYNFVIAKAGLEQTLGYDFTETSSNR